MIECIMLDTGKIIDGDTGNQLSQSDKVVGQRSYKRDTPLYKEIPTELKVHDTPSVGDIRRNGDKS